MSATATSGSGTGAASPAPEVTLNTSAGEEAKDGGSTIHDAIQVTEDEREHYTRLYVSVKSMTESKQVGVWFYLSNPDLIHRIKLDATWRDQQPILSHLFTIMNREFSERRRFDHNYEKILSAVFASLEKFGFEFQAVGFGRMNAIHYLLTSLLNRDPNLVLRLVRVLVRLPTFKLAHLSYTRPAPLSMIHPPVVNKPIRISIYQHLLGWYRPADRKWQFDHMTATQKERTEYYAKLSAQFEVMGELMAVDTITLNQSEVDPNLHHLFDYVLSTWMQDGVPSANGTTICIQDLDQYLLSWKSETPCEVVLRFLIAIPAPFLLRMNLSSSRLQVARSTNSGELMQLPSYLEIIRTIIHRWKYNTPAILLEQVFTVVARWQQTQHEQQPHQISNHHPVSINNHTEDTPSTVSSILSSFSSSSSLDHSPADLIQSISRDECMASDIHDYLETTLAHVHVHLAPWILLHAIAHHPSDPSLTQDIHTFLTTQPNWSGLLESRLVIYCKDEAGRPSVSMRRTLFGGILSKYLQLMSGDEAILVNLIEKGIQNEPIAAEQFLRELILQWPTSHPWIIKLFSLLLPLQILPDLSSMLQRTVPLSAPPLVLFIDRMVKKDFKVRTDGTTDWMKVDLLCTAFLKDIYRIFTLITHRCLRSKYVRGLKLWLNSPIMMESIDSPCPIFWLSEIVDDFIELVEQRFYFNKMIPIIWKEIRTGYEKITSATCHSILPILSRECQQPSDVINYVLLPYLHHTNLTDQYPFTRSTERPPVTPSHLPSTADSSPLSLEPAADGVESVQKNASGSVASASALCRDILILIFQNLEFTDFLNACVINRSWYTTGRTIKSREESWKCSQSIILLAKSSLRIHITRLHLSLVTPIDFGDLVLLRDRMNHLVELQLYIPLTDHHFSNLSFESSLWTFPTNLNELILQFDYRGVMSAWVTDHHCRTYLSGCVKQIVSHSTRLSKLSLRILSSVREWECPPELKSLSTLTELKLDQFNLNQQIDLVKSMPNLRRWIPPRYLSPESIERLVAGSPSFLEDINPIVHRVEEADAIQLRKLQNLTRLDMWSLTLDDPNVLFPYLKFLKILNLTCLDSVNPNHLTTALSTCTTLSNLSILNFQLTSDHLSLFLPHLISLEELKLNGCDLVTLGFLTSSKMSLTNLRSFEVRNSRKLPPKEFEHLRAISSSLESLMIWYSSSQPFDSATIYQWTPSSTEFRRHEWPRLKEFTLAQEPVSSVPVAATGEEAEGFECDAFLGLNRNGDD